MTGCAPFVPQSRLQPNASCVVRPAHKDIQPQVPQRLFNDSQICVSVLFCLTCRLAAGSLSQLNSGSKPGGTTFCASNVSCQQKQNPLKTDMTFFSQLSEIRVFWVFLKPANLFEYCRRDFSTLHLCFILSILMSAGV